MKNTIKLLTAVLIIAFTFTSCDEDDIKSIADVTVETSLSETFGLNFKAETQEEINESMTINLADNNSIAEYLNKLKKIKITKITYEITEFSGDNYTEMNVGYYINGNTIVAPKNYNVNDSKGVEYEIIDSDILQTISTTLLNNKQVTLELKGDYQSLQNATGKITVTVYFEATANPL
ncbi:hypothetical protein SAMN05444411_101166 [Lutibacter oricola]|uniref:Uncharacterized protein n=1 Tax=Lutibacter oricola TaxID=762486 RepID=A0A1H2R6S6_9FLAO|nr:hypothetical protein [Lutibacter oricola]SDW15163.1 hypothetical protein SAMN05444411_101166 [Lutibacter oricola]